MPTYIIEREMPGAAQLTDDDPRGTSAISNKAVAELSRPLTWRHARRGLGAAAAG